MLVRFASRRSTRECVVDKCATADAKYVHFFHEKIPSRAMEQYTPLDPLDEIISSLPMEQQAPPLRTRALVQIFKRQWEGAILDFTMALRITDEIRRSHKPDQQQLELASKMREEQETWNTGYRDWRAVPQLKDEEQPSSLEKQLLFNRAGVYLTLACQSVHTALDGLKEYQEAQVNGETHGLDARAQDVRLDARKRVKGFAKKAIKDYMAFLGHFDYTPGLSFEITNEIMRRVHDLANGNKTQTPLPKSRLVDLSASDDESSHSDGTNGRHDDSGALVKHQNLKSEPFELGEDGWPKFPTPKIYPASALFAEKPLTDLPPVTTADVNGDAHANKPIHDAFGSREAVTYHPLMLDALHSLLLAHSLIQTSATEHLRHAQNAARIARIADGYPLFQAARSPARADWIEVLRRANNWIGLSVPWQKMCTPAPLPDEAGGWAKESTASSSASSTSPSSDALSTNKHKSGFSGKEETPDQKRERIKQESIIDALSDDRVVDEESFQRAVRARERRAIEDEEGLSGPLKDKVSMSPARATSTPNGKGVKRSEQAESEKDYPISTDRAEAIARWIREAPLSVGGNKKKRPAKRKKPDVGDGSAVTVNGAVNDAPAEGIAEMSLNATT